MKLVALSAALAATLSVAPALAAPLQCSDNTVIGFVNSGLNTNATWGNGARADSKGTLRIVGTPHTELARKNILVCGIHIVHTDPTNGAKENLRARLTVNLRRDGSVLNASMKFLESSR
jgi:hypothetical protein